MNTILVAIVVLTMSGSPISNAWVDVKDMVHTNFYIEQLTDSSGKFVVEVEPGEHEFTVIKPGFKPFKGVLTGDIIVTLEVE